MADELSQKQIDLLVYIRRRLSHLPLLPMVVARLFSLDPDDDDYFDQVLNLAQKDPSFAVRVLQLSNTVVNSPRGNVMGIQAALARVGTRQIDELIKEMSIAKVFMPSTRNQQNLWTHSVQTAVIARTICSLNTRLDVDPETAYLCGLLHDVGRFVLFENSPGDLGKVDETGWKTLSELIEAEKQLVGLPHTEIGFRAAQKWRLPEFVSDVIHNHHAYTEAEAPTRKVKKEEDLLKSVQMADFMSVIIMVHPKFLRLSEEGMVKVIGNRCTHPNWTRSPVAPELLAKRVDRINEEASAIIRDLGLRAA